MGKVKYSPEMRAQTVKYILEVGKSASKAAERIKRSAATIIRPSGACAFYLHFCH